MDQKENAGKIWAWVVVAVIVVAVIVYLGVTGGFDLGTPTEPEVIEDQQELSETTNTSSVSEEGVVLQDDNETPVVNDALPMSPEAPQQSDPISEADLPASAVKIAMTRDGGFSPSSFSVSPGQAVTLSATSEDAYTHVFAFRDAELSAVAIGVGPGETRAITFNAPTTEGSYEFYCNVPGHSAEVGTMIVE